MEILAMQDNAAARQSQPLGGGLGLSDRAFCIVTLEMMDLL
jgi:hypothetical protein